FGSEDEDVEPVDKGKKKSEGATACQSYTPAQLEAETAKEIREVCAILGLQNPIASILLRHFRWNKERLIDAYMESPEQVLTSSGEPSPVASPNSPTPNTPRPSKRARLTPEEVVFMCPICCDDIKEETGLFKERCGHTFCTSCWKDYVIGKVKEEGQCDFTCMQDGCKTVVEERTVKELVDEPVLKRYQFLILESLIKSRSSLRFCPFPGCEQVVCCHNATPSSILVQVPTVACSDAHTFCFGCGLDADHRPVICALAKLWLKDAKDDSGSSSWIKANTKICPNCQNATEKNGGCNRIHCRSCDFQWCWMCEKNWNVHGYNGTCNAYNEKSASETKDAQAMAAEKLEKWLFYYDRYNNHDLSAKLDKELYERTEQKIKEVQEASGLSWIQARFMQDAVDELTRCRITLKWSYAMG
ncbi:hypothetical protein M422DRAFT_39761, partial [Sphaerobolus stellatus SS14]